MISKNFFFSGGKKPSCVPRYVHTTQPIMDPYSWFPQNLIDSQQFSIIANSVAIAFGKTHCVCKFVYACICGLAMRNVTLFQCNSIDRSWPVLDGKAAAPKLSSQGFNAFRGIYQTIYDNECRNHQTQRSSARFGNM